MSSINDLSNEIAKLLARYTDDIEKEIQKAQDDVTKQGISLLKSDSPKRTGSYRKGWTKKKDGNSTIIHNKTHYQLTHLLENGHVKRGGGRVAPKVHIKPVEEKMIEEFEKRVERVIKQ